MAYFYSHIVQIQTVTTQLDQMNLKDDHKNQLSQLIDATVHHTVMDVILSRLPEADKKVFLDRLHHNPTDPDLMNFLKERVETIEDEIKEAVLELKDELHQDVQEAREK